jgi:hypothetical protein
VEPLPVHLAVVVDFPRPVTIKELQGFLGMVNFYLRFLPGAAKVLKALTDRLRDGPKGTTETSLETSFENAKQLLASATRLAYLDQALKLGALGVLPGDTPFPVYAGRMGLHQLHKPQAADRRHQPLFRPLDSQSVPAAHLSGQYT